MAGMQTKLSPMADQAGTYDGMSSNCSSAGFSDMKFSALTLSRRGFNRWLVMIRHSRRTSERERVPVAGQTVLSVVLIVRGSMSITHNLDHNMRPMPPD